MDDRVRRYLESKAGISLCASRGNAVTVRESPKRTNEPGNRVLVQRLAGSDGLLVTVVPGSVDAIAHVVRSMTPCEIFSPLGRAELCRALGVNGRAPGREYIYGFESVLTNLEDFCSAETRHTVTPLTKQDIPAEQFGLRMSERRKPVSDEFIWAFACYRNAPEFRAAELAPFGAQCASIAIVIWKDGPVATYGVGTEEGLRGQGYGLAAVSAATKWILEQGEVTVYGAYANNIPSLRIARRLGFALLQQEMGV